MHVSLFAVVVIYNKSINDSETICNLLSLRIEQLEIIVVDNSTLEYYNKEECDKKNITYISMSGNKGLSKAYNSALSYIRSNSKDDDIIIWLDDDTHITKEYFIKLEESFSNNVGEVFAPIIYGQDGRIYSPNNAGFLRNKLLKAADEKIDFKRFNAINSCLAVKQYVYKNYWYDENLFLDSVDKKFFDDLRIKNAEFKILYTPIIHNFSQREKEIDLLQMTNRLRIRVTDLMTYSRKGIKYTFLGVVKAYGWGVVFSLKCKSLVLLTVCIKYSAIGFYTNLRIFAGVGDKKDNK